MKVAAQRRADVTATKIPGAGTQFDKSIGRAAGHRLGDHFRGLGPDAGQRLPAVGGAVALPLGLRQPLDNVGGVAGFLFAFESIAAVHSLPPSSADAILSPSVLES